MKEWIDEKKLTKEDFIRSKDIINNFCAYKFLPVREFAAFAVAVICVEKQIPEKPIKAIRITKKNGALYMNDDNEYFKCPMCTKYDVPLRNKQAYCHCCGQKLDWKGVL